MPQHYTRNTVSVSVWCKVCGRATMHRVDGTRRGPCLDCLAERVRQATLRAAAKKPEAKQGDLFR